MIYSKTSEYAIRALIYFVDRPENAPLLTVREVSRGTGVPQSYIAKIFQCLVSSSILRSRRGPSGGFSLAVPAQKLSALKVVRALDNAAHSPFSRCVMGFRHCNDRVPCPLHPVWSDAKDKMREKLAQCTISDLAGLTGKFRPGRERRAVLSDRMRNIFSI